MSFGMYLLAVFCSPLYFVVRGRVLVGILHTIALVIAVPFIFVLGLGFFIWFMCVLHAIWDLRHAMQDKAMEKQAELIAAKLASKTEVDQQS